MDLGILLHQPDYSKSYEVCMRHWDVCKPWLKHTLIIAHHLWVKSTYVVGFQFPCNIPGVRGSSSMHCIVMKITAFGLQCYYLYAIHSHKAFALYQVHPGDMKSWAPQLPAPMPMTLLGIPRCCCGHWILVATPAPHVALCPAPDTARWIYHLPRTLCH